MNNIDNGGPAFPLTEDAVNHRNKDFDMQGMTLRDYFAAKAMQSILMIDREFYASGTAIQAYRIADAMIEARKTKP